MHLILTTSASRGTDTGNDSKIIPRVLHVRFEISCHRTSFLYGQDKQAGDEHSPSDQIEQLDSSITHSSVDVQWFSNRVLEVRCHPRSGFQIFDMTFCLFQGSSPFVPLFAMGTVEPDPQGGRGDQTVIPDYADGAAVT